MAAHLTGSIPLGHGYTARTFTGEPGDYRASLVIDPARSSLPRGGSSDDISRAWSSASGGGVVVTAGGREFCVGVISARDIREAPNALKVASLDLIDKLADEKAASFWELCGAADAANLLSLGESVGTAQIVMGTIPQQVPEFVARGALDDLIGRLDQQAVATPVSLSGLRGVGKSQVAAGVAQHCMRQGWAVVAWIESESRQQVLAGLSLLADRLGLTGQDEPPEVGVARLLSVWNSDPGTQRLVVFDNLVDADALAGLMPQAGCATIVVTTADRAALIGEVVDITAFTPAMAQGYLQARTGLKDSNGADALGRELGYLPLALASAAWTILRRRRINPNYGYSDYLAELDIQPLDKMLPRVKSVLDYPRPTVGALALAVQTALDSAPDASLAGVVLGIFAWLDPNGVRRSWLNRLGEQFDVEEALVVIADSALVQPSQTGASLIMHRLVARVVRQLAEETGWAEGAKSGALSVVNAVQPLDRDDYWDQRSEASELAAHVRGLLGKLAASDNVRPVIAAGLRSGHVLNRLGAIHEAISVLTATEQVARTRLGANDLDGLAAGDALAVAYHESGDLAHATTLYEQNAAKLEETLGNHHTITLTARDHLAGAYLEAGELARAVPLFERTLADLLEASGANDPQTLRTRNGLATAYQAAGELARAVSLFEQTLADQERILGPTEPGTLATRQNLAAAYQEAGNLVRAIPLHEQTLGDLTEAMGADHPQTLAASDNLAGAYEDAGDLDRALPLFEKTLAALERVLGPGHPHTLSARNNLAFSYKAAGALDRAIPLFEKTISDQVRVLGSDHPKTLITRDNLAVSYQAVGDLSRAIPMFNQTIADQVRVLGPDHPNTLTSCTNLAVAYYQAGDAVRAKSLTEQTLAARMRVLGPDHPDTLISRTNLATAYHAAGDLGGALPLYESVLADRERLLGRGHPQTISSRARLVFALVDAASDFAKAHELAAANVEACLAAFGPDDERTLDRRKGLAFAFLGFGRRAEGIEELRVLLADCWRVLGEHQLTQIVEQRLLRETLT